LVLKIAKKSSEVASESAKLIPSESVSLLAFPSIVSYAVEARAAGDKQKEED
jgi:hypothetical protein